MISFFVLLVIIGCMILGFNAGLMGTFTLLRKESLLADAISHAALPGIAVMFLITHSQHHLILLSGGAISGFLGTLVVLFLLRKTSLKKDTVLGFVLSFFFGIGLVLLTIIEKQAVAQQSVLNKFLFGNAAMFLVNDVVWIAIISFLLLCVLAVCWKELVIITFDETFAHTLGYTIWVMEGLIISLLVITIVLGLQMGGVLLMSSLFVAPAVAARQWTKHVETMALLAGIFGAIASGIGAFISSQVEKMPVGPLIVVIMSLCVFISLLCAPERGFLWRLQRN